MGIFLNVQRVCLKQFVYLKQEKITKTKYQKLSKFEKRVYLIISLTCQSVPLGTTDVFITHN